MEHRVTDLVKIAQALSEGEFDQEFRRHFHGELGRLAAYLESLRRNLMALSPTVGTSAHLIPEASRGVVEISQQAETGVISILELVEEMLADQEKVVDLLKGADEPSSISLLESIAKKSRRSLMSLLSYLSFQDVVRQRAEKVLEITDEVEKNIVEFLAKFNVQINKPSSTEKVVDRSEDGGLEQGLIDRLLGDLE